MTRVHTRHSINLALIDAHVEASKPSAARVSRLLESVRAYIDSSDDSYGSSFPGFLSSIGVFFETALDDTASVLRRWDEFDTDLKTLSELMAEHGKDHVPIMYRPIGEYRYIIAAGNLDGSIDFDKQSESTQANGHKWDPDFFLASVKGAPEDLRQAAYDLWLEDAIARTPIYTGSFLMSGEVTIKFIELGADLAYRRDEFSDGRVQLTFEVSGNLGVAFNAKMVDASVGVEGGLLVMHEFDSERDADAFLDRLMSEAMPDGWDAALMFTPGGASLAAGRNVAQVLNVLSDDSSMESCIGSIGAYGEFEVEAGEWMEANAGLHVGYGRDFVADQNIMYLEFDTEVSFESPLGSFAGTAAEVEAGVALGIAGEQRWGPGGESFVDLEFTLMLDAGFEFEHVESLFPGLDLGEVDVSGGVELSLRAYLELDDATAKSSWKNVLNPIDSTLNQRDLWTFLNRADINAELSAVSQVEHADIDWLAAEFTLEEEKRRTMVRWVKAPGDGFERVKL